MPDFLDANAHYKTNETLHSMLNAEVIRRQNAAIKAGGDQFDPSILVEADKAIKASLAAMGVKPAAPAAKTAEQLAADAAAGKDSGKSKLTVQPKAEIPPSLRNLPAEDHTATESKWAGLDRLAEADPVAFEDAMARLPEADRDAFLARH